MKLQWKWAESVNGRFLRKFPLFPQSLTHCPPVSFTKPLPASHANQQSVWRRDWDQFENFFGHNFAFFTTNIKQILSKLPRVVLLKGVGKCGCTILPKIYTFYVVLDVFLKVLKFFFLKRPKYNRSQVISVILLDFPQFLCFMIS